jgi:hypothetical protein
MKNKRWSVLGFAALASVSLLLPAGVALAAKLSSSIPAGRQAMQSGAWPTRYFAPYVYVEPGPTTSSNPNQIVKAAQQTGNKYYILGLIITSGCQAIWGDSTKVGQSPAGSPSGTGDPVMMAIDQLRSMGGDVAISFGGANGQELAQGCTDVGSLQQQYQNVVDTYHVTHIDIDLEGAAITDTASIDRRNQALAALQKANPNLIITYTLPVMPTGLTDDGVKLLQNTLQHGVTLSVVNIMTMDYGQPSNQMGPNAISAAQATEKQLASINLSAKIGITPMIGQNDSQGEIFSLDDARNLVQFADKDPAIAELSMWSLGRDQPCSGGASGSASPVCSSISQQLYDFTKIFSQFPDGSPPPLPSPSPVSTPQATSTQSPQPTSLAQPTQTPQPTPLAQPPQPSWSFPCSDIQSSTGHGSQPSENVISKDWLSGDVAEDTNANTVSQGGHFLSTYVADTYDFPQISTLFPYAEGLAFLLITPSVILLGYQIMLGASSFRHAGALEGFSHVLLGALAVTVSFELVQMLIQLEGSMTKAILLLHAQHPFPQTTVNGTPVPYTLPDATAPGEPATSYRAIVVPMSRWGCALNDFIGVFSVPFLENTFASVIPLLGGLAHLAGRATTISDLIHHIGRVVLVVLSILLWGQVFLRILLINYYILTAPLVFGCWALPGGVGQNVVRLWCKGFLTMLFVQVVQLFILTTLPLLLPTLPQISSDNMGILQGLLLQFPPILALCLTLIAPRFLGASMARALGIAGGMIVAVGTVASQI